MAFQKLNPVYKLVKVAQRRKKGDIVNIATELGFSESHVSNVLAGRRFNESITNTAYRMAYRRETLMDKLETLTAKLDTTSN
jgi:hypothetical protein